MAQLLDVYKRQVPGESGAFGRSYRLRGVAAPGEETPGEPVGYGPAGMALPLEGERARALEITTMVQMLAEGFLTSLQIFALTLVGALPLGMVVAFLRGSRCVVVRAITRVYISVMRGTPLMLQMFAIYFMPYYVFGIQLTPDSKWQATIVAFIINYAAYFAEIYRSCLLYTSRCV